MGRRLYVWIFLGLKIPLAFSALRWNHMRVSEKIIDLFIRSATDRKHRCFFLGKSINQSPEGQALKEASPLTLRCFGKKRGLNG